MRKTIVGLSVCMYLWYNMARNWVIRRIAKDRRNIKLRGSTCQQGRQLLRMFEFQQHRKTFKNVAGLSWQQMYFRECLSNLRYSPDRVPFGKYFGIVILITSFPIACRKKVAATHKIMKYRNTAWREEGEYFLLASI